MVTAIEPKPKTRTKRTNALTANYDAVVQKARRRVNAVNMKHEDKVLVPRDRDRLVSEARVLRRNAAVVAWAIRKHLDYVSTFNFQCRSGNGELDDRIEGLVRWWQRPLNCDVAGRHSLQQMIRMAEGLRTTDGDCFLMKLSDGKLQIIEGDRVRTPTDLGEFTRDEFDAKKFVHGVETTEAGKPLRYAVCDRGDNGFVLRSVIPAQHVYQHGYFDRYDQTRGISPLSSAINSFCDVYEASEYALAKMKLSQIFALKMTLGGEPEEADTGVGYSFDFGSGPQTIQLDPGDDAQFLESSQPSTQFQQFLQAGIAIGLKSLDIPYSFYDESWTTYSGARQALIMYEQSAANKRETVQQLLNAMTVWRLNLFIQDGYLQLPENMGMEDVRFEWLPAALPWIDPQKEATANALLIASQLKSRQEICKEQGKDWFEVVDQIRQEEQYIKSQGLTVGTTPPIDVVTPDSEDEEEAEQEEEKPKGRAA